jgi:hypothetical protein
MAVTRADCVPECSPPQSPRRHLCEDGDAEDRQAAGSTVPRARSGDFGQDPAFDAAKLFEVIGGDENVERVSQAVRAFLAR